MICLSTHWIFCFLFFDHLFQFMYNLPDYCFVYNLPVTISINTCDKSLLPPASKIYNIDITKLKVKVLISVQWSTESFIIHSSFTLYLS